MDILIVALQWVLAATLALAAVGKLLDVPGSRAAVRDFGVPARYANPLGTMLPFGELALAILLIPGVTSRWAALGAFLLFGVFIVAIAYNLLQGRRPNCHCFGKIQSSPSSWMTVGRNGVFALIAAIVVITGGRGAIDTYRDLSDVGRVGVLVTLVMLAVSAVQGWFLYNIWRRQEHLLANQDSFQTAQFFSGLGLATSQDSTAAHINLPDSDASVAPMFDIPALDGGRLTMAGLLEPGKPVLLFFTSPNCAFCQAMLPELVEWNQRFASDMTIALIGQEDIEDNRHKLDEFGLVNAAVQAAREVSDAFGIQGTPSSVIVMPDGTIQGGVAQGRAEIERRVGMLLRDQMQQKSASTFEAPVRTANAPIEDSDVWPAPVFDLPTPDGARVSLENLLTRRKPVLLIFWSTTCGFCERFAPEAADWGRRFTDDVTIAFISGGSVEANQTHMDTFGLTNLGVQDAGEVQQSYGTAGTPTGVLVQPDGSVLDPVAVGAPEIRRLLGRAINRNGHASLPSPAPAAVDGSDADHDETTEEAIRRMLLRPVAGPETGTPASRLPFADLDGRFVGLDEYRGADTVLVFWNVDCEFCQRILPDLKEWEREAGSDTSRVLIASQGDIEANRQQGLQSRVVLDDAFVMASGFGASGTPAAIRLDKDGRVASDLAIGADSVLDVLYDFIEPPVDLLTETRS